MPDLKMLNSTKYLYNLTFIKCSYEPEPQDFSSYQIVLEITQTGH